MTKLTVHELGRLMSATACEPDKVLVRSLGMTPTLAWNVAKDKFQEAFNRKPTEDDEDAFTDGFEIGLLEAARDEAEQALAEL